MVTDNSYMLQLNNKVYNKRSSCKSAVGCKPSAQQCTKGKTVLLKAFHFIAVSTYVTQHLVMQKTSVFCELTFLSVKAGLI